jgi:hypothetical protein
VLNISKMECNDYYGSSEYHADFANGLIPSTKSDSTKLQAGELTASEFWRGIIREKTHSSELKDA